MKPRILDLFCGAGGAAVGYHRAGFEVIGVDLEPQPNYPFEFIQADALWFMERMVYPDFVYDLCLNHFAAIHASPPCQAFSTKTRDKTKHLDLITPIRPLLRATGLPYVIENVSGAPLVDAVKLCGSSFGLDVQRHRWFETNFDLAGLPCTHGWQKPRFKVYDHGRWYLSRVVPVFGTGGGKARAHWRSAMGVDWTTDAELAEAIPPAFTTWIGWQLAKVVKARSSWSEVAA